MPPKRRIKKQVLVASAEPCLLTLEEMQAKELKHHKRLLDLNKCPRFIEDAHSQVYSLNQQQKLQDKWLNFVTCNPLPKPNIPAEMHRFYTKLIYKEKENVSSNLSWLLSVDERSILSHDMFKPDLTRSKLHPKNIGNEYQNYITDSMKILQNIDNLLDNDMEVAKCPVAVLDDIVKHKTFIKDEIMGLMDRFTYRIISSENSEMRSLDAITAEYFFNAEDIKIHIWCLKNVPIRFSHLSEPRLLANFHSINLLLQIPFDMLKENLLVRLIHMSFDHFSDKISSFTAPTPGFIENRTIGLLDLRDCLVNEWTLQMEIQAKTLQEMRQARLEYEEKNRLYEEQVENYTKQKKPNGKTKKVKKPVKPGIEPIAVGSDMVPDIYDKFLQEEQKQYENFIQEAYRPELFNFSRHEINLRKYSILGGIYQLYYIEKPKHIDFNSFNMSWHHNESKLVIDRNAKILDGSRLSIQPQTSRRFTRRMTVLEAETIYSDPNIASPWFIVTLKLPDYLCFWGEPIACHFEEIFRKVETSQSVKTSENKEDLNNVKEQLTLEQDELNAKINAAPSKIVLDLPSPDHTESKRRKTFFQESLANLLLNKRKTELLSGARKESLYINDFSLLKTLTKQEIRHIERHIIPRIISSYKLPKEVQREESQLFSKKSKGKGGRIIAQKHRNVPPKLSGGQFTFGDIQNNPERVFASYPSVETLHIISCLSDLNLNKNQKIPETFGELLQVVEDVKQQYQAVANKMKDLSALERPIVVSNKRIKRMLRSYNRSSTEPASTISSLDSKEPPEENKIHQENNLPVDRSDSSVDRNNLTEDVSSLNENKSEMKSYRQWTTEYILKSEFDRETQTIIFHTDRLGNFGFAFNRYEHFPFNYWNMEPNANDPDNEVIFTLDTKHVTCVLYISSSGIRAKVMEPLTSNAGNPKMYLIIENPIKDFKEFKKLMQAHHLNIFADPDASFYIEKDHRCEKHLSTELHTYSCMAVHCTQMHFSYSLWNRLAKRRDIILKFIKCEDQKNDPVEVRITPGEAFFVEIQESCSDDLNVIDLTYNPTWRNMASYSDLHHLIVAMYLTAIDLRCKTPRMICLIRDLLSEVRPFSFS